MGTGVSLHLVQVTEFLTKMKLDPDELVSVEDIAPQSEDGTVVVTQRAQTCCQCQLVVSSGCDHL